MIIIIRRSLPKIENGINDNIKKLGFNANVARVGSMMTLFFTEKNYVRNFKDANQCNTNSYAKYFNHMLKMGIYLPPSQYECLFLSNKIGDKDIKKIIESNYKALKKIK